MESLKQTFVAATALCIIAGILLVPYIPSFAAQVAGAKAQPVPITAQRTNIPADPSVIQGLPRIISVPSLNLQLTVQDGVFDTASQLWTIDEENIFYATPTYPINSSAGSTLLYGHNSDVLFGKLPQLEPGAEAHITTDTGYVFTYAYTDNEIVDPTNVEVLHYDGTPRIALQTCTGFWNEHRQMFYFYLKGYKKS